ncbi:hypothetical protein VTI74DRAFT_10109 [Chaetomium olivicolor]
MVHGKDNPNAGDADSALAVPSDLSDTTSIASFVFKYRQQHGRTYHAYKTDGEYKPYFMPNDARESERLDHQHTLFMTQDDRLYLCPAGKDKPMQRVLDIGTGTCDEHPGTNVIGVDLCAIQPEFVPPNVEFFVDDLEQEWNFVQPFDFIYSRGMAGAIKDWPKLMAQAYRHLRPGGWIELYDPDTRLCCDDGSVPEDSALSRWNALMLEAAAENGAPIDSALEYKQQLIDAGFQNVRQVEFKWPSNTWPKDKKWKEVGAWANMNMMEALQGMTTMLFTSVLGWSPADVELLLVDVRKDFKNRDYHAYWPMYVVYGQKPE